MRALKRLLVVCAMVGLCALGARAQGRGSGGPPGASRGPGMPGGGGRSGDGPANGRAGANGPSIEAGNTGSTAGTRGVLRLGPSGRWWDDSRVVRTVGLSREQQRRMDSIFDANKTAIVSSYTALQTERAKLVAMTSGAQVDQGRVFAQIDVVSQARTSLEKATTQMLLQIRGELKPEQMQKLETVQ